MTMYDEALAIADVLETSGGHALAERIRNAASGSFSSSEFLSGVGAVLEHEVKPTVAEPELKHRIERLLREMRRAWDG